MTITFHKSNISNQLNTRFLLQEIAVDQTVNFPEAFITLVFER